MTRLDEPWLTDPASQAVCATLGKASDQVFFVGGCVRNALLGVPVSDLDLTTDLTPDRVTTLAEGAGFKVIPTGIDHGTVTIVANDIPFEVTTFRRDVSTDGRRATVAFSAQIKDDAMRRDFTMNALYADATGRVLDPTGMGLHDLGNRRLRFIGQAIDRIREDRLRSLRFFRFHAWYGRPDAGLDPDALSAIALEPELARDLSKERITAELAKLLSAPDPAPAMAAMMQTGLLPALLPGAELTMLAPLIHMESLLDLAPDAMLRLAAIGPEEAPGHLRLSRRDKTAFTRFRSEVATTTGIAELAYRHGAADALAVAALRAALVTAPPPGDTRQQADHGAAARFPITAADLMPAISGPDLGITLKRLEADWIASDFRLDRDTLLKHAQKG